MLHCGVIFKSGLNVGVKMGLVILTLFGMLIFFCILYLVVCGAVENGVFNALIRYDELKKKENKNESRL